MDPTYQILMWHSRCLEGILSNDKHQNVLFVASQLCQLTPSDADELLDRPSGNPIALRYQR